MCLEIKPKLTQTIFGLDASTWEVIATLSQAAAAAGALSLLYITWKSGKDAKDVIQNSQKLADATEKLVIESRAQKNLSVMPVIEASFDPSKRRITITNKGNGPLLKPTIEFGGGNISLIGEILETAENSELAVLPCEGTATSNLPEVHEANSTIIIKGILISGGRYCSQLNISSFKNSNRLLAQ